MTQPAETTGSHPIPPTSDSEPPISKHGVSWKTVGIILGFLLTAAIPTATLLVGFGRVLADVEDARGEVRALRLEVRELGSGVGTNRERLAVLRRDVDALDRDLERLQRRTAPTRER